MSKTLLNASNEILKRTQIIAGDSGELSSLTDSARQHFIDVCVQVVNEGIDELYTATNKSKPQEQAESSIALVASTRSYSLASDLIQLRWPLIDKTNSQFIYQYPGGYNQILVDDPEQDDTGLPSCAAISPVNGQLYLDRIPTSVEAGRTYTYQYDKDLVMDAAADTMPFSDATFRAMVPAWVQLWKRELRGEFDGDLFKQSIGRASRIFIQVQPRKSYSPRR